MLSIGSESEEFADSSGLLQITNSIHIVRQGYVHPGTPSGVFKIPQLFNRSSHRLGYDVYLQRGSFKLQLFESFLCLCIKVCFSSQL
jgi:hypothetical protein